MILTELKPGDKGIITDLSKVNELIQRRLLDLGVIEGREVCYKCSLPFGGPCMLEVSGQCIGIRKKEAMQIKVECS
ncbi:FeoA family protein [Heyndrickxia ginsengihumi]|uniref:Ferrous iron transport protein A n=1 Tax=Heyndrickxia ginsengihumi TaxID=363870 RepID=A0A0A6VFS0_9BACI|nr:FeoA family protein [Heyndrickxia ginsengihumi]KHD85469.1 iron transporter FeoA [Heyndrickxia ginsengihumi]MBE6185645.1 ferrous iron transport protein A [Bacillus sp. (in: firmicutes)]MCM3023868.1 ferrous iron transport protein A [Heyndrickxia ginsengihumi]NEY20711.1 ferrous iron transport protein A [Heyndrickxia ginsengihumi]